MARSRRTKIPVEVRMRVVLAVLSGEMPGAEAARRHGVSDMPVSKRKQQLLDASRQRLVAGFGSGTSDRIGAITDAAGNKRVVLLECKSGKEPTRGGNSRLKGVIFGYS